ncbi:MAG: ethylbenzene dehydrogenase-related protein [Dehalococcoidia bacterium]
MRKQTVWMMTVAAATAALAVACGGGAEKPAAGTGTAAAGTAKASATTAAKVDPNTLAAKKASPGSLAVDDPAWNGAPVMKAQMELIKGTSPKEAGTVNAQALYSDTDVWFRFQWADKTQDIKSVYKWDGTKWTALPVKPAAADRFAVIWPIGTVAGFEAKGCYAACHREGGAASKDAAIDKGMYMLAPGEKDLLDMWQWTGSASFALGQLNDGRLQGTLVDPKVTSEGGIVKDKATGGGTVSNAAPAPAVGPVKMQDPAKKPSLGPEFLKADEAVALDMTKVKVGDEIPRSMIGTPIVGSNGDVESKSTWANGQYTIVLHRKLNTTNDDDIKFEAGKSYLFEIAVWDGVDQEHHTPAKDVYTLTLK